MSGTPSSYAPGDASVQGHLDGIDTALGNVATHVVHPVFIAFDMSNVDGSDNLPDRVVGFEYTVSGTTIAEILAFSPTLPARIGVRVDWDFAIYSMNLDSGAPNGYTMTLLTELHLGDLLVDNFGSVITVSDEAGDPIWEVSYSKHVVIQATPTNYTFVGYPDLEGHLKGIDDALGTLLGGSLDPTEENFVVAMEVLT